MMSAVYSRRASKRHGTAVRRADHHRGADDATGPGAWRAPPKPAAAASGGAPPAGRRVAPKSMVVRSLGQPVAPPRPKRPAAGPPETLGRTDETPSTTPGPVHGADAARSDLDRDVKAIGDALLGKAFGPDAGRRGRIVLITSPGAGEGKTFVALELALSVVRAEGPTVLLVDAGARGRGMARLLDLPDGPGLADALASSDVDLESLARPSASDRLAVVGAGEPRPCPLDLLVSQPMARLADAMLADADRLVLIDGPSLLEGPQARVLAALAGQVVLVIEAGRTSLQAIDQAQRLLSGHPGVGLVLNREPRIGASWRPWRSHRST